MGYTPTQLQLEQMAAEEALKRKQWTPQKFLVEVEKFCDKHDYSIIDGVVEYCKFHELDYEMVAKHLMSDRLYSLIQDDAEHKRMIKKTNRLAFQ